MKRYDGRCALVTGGSSGIGKATAMRLAGEGAKVVISARDSARLQRTAAELAGFGTVSAVAADVSQEGQVTYLVREASRLMGGIDVLVHSAGIDGAGATVVTMELSTWEAVLAANLTGAFLVAREVGILMAAAGGGSMAIVSSLNGIAAEPGFADYNAAKGGVILLAQTLALELVKHNIRVNAVCPGYILTPMTEQYAADPVVAASIRAAIPMERFGTADEVAAAIAFLCSEDASYITGHALVIDGGRHARQ